MNSFLNSAVTLKFLLHRMKLIHHHVLNVSLNAYTYLLFYYIDFSVHACMHAGGHAYKKKTKKTKIKKIN